MNNTYLRDIKQRLARTWLVRLGALLSAAFFFSGCTIAPEPKPDQVDYAPVLTSTRSLQEAPPGTIVAGGFATSLFGDQRATRVGDIITIMLEERTSSTKSQATNLSKESEFEMNEANILGTLLSAANMSLLSDPESSSSFAGQADADQSNSLSGSISVTVADVLPNGNLVVRGEKWLTLNKGDEYIRLSGIVRPQDVNPDNTISSTKMANARIAYSGTGDLNDVNKQGWLTRFFNSEYWPF